MRNSWLITGVIIVWICNCSSRKVTEVDEHLNEEIHSQTADAEGKKNSTLHLDTNLIRECAERGISSFNMDSLSDPGKFLDNSLIDEVFGKLPVNGHADWKLEANEYLRFSCHQWEEDNTYFYFTLLQQDESCCLTMFLCVTDKKGKLLAIRQLGVAGSDGGWSGNDQGERIGFGKFKVSNESSYDKEEYEKGINKGFRRKFEFSQLLIDWDIRENRFKVDTLYYSSTDTLILHKKSY